MARLIPKTAIEDISNKPERDVAKVLVEQLPENNIVYHSYPWLRADRGARGSTVLQEGEADFVVVIPEIGFLILEVKGGEIDYDATDHLWFRKLPNGATREIKDPFEQAGKNMHHLKDEIAKYSFAAEKRVPCAYGYAVVFPDCNYTGSVPPGADGSIILSADDLPFLSRRIPEIMRKCSRQAKPKPMSKKELDSIVKALSPVFNLLPVLFRRIEEQEERLFRLTEEQMNMLNFLQNHDRAAIEGVAGSGKTLLAMAQAQRFADKSLNTLLLCYNRALADWLEASLPEQYQGRITITNFHRLCRQHCLGAGIPFKVPSGDGQSFWKHKAPELFVDALSQSDKQFDAVVVDEGQDFFSDWWMPLEMIVPKDGPFYVFYDPSQNLFVGDDLTIPGVGKPFHLPTNCRNTRRIAATCSRVRGVEIPVKKDAPEGDETIIEVATTPKRQLQLCQQFVGEWLGKGKLKPSQIVIQGPNVLKNSSLSGTTNIRNTPIIESLESWKSNEGILYATIRSFKGLEADAVIIIDVPRPDSLPYFTSADFYVACSRAKHLLVILPTAEGIP